MPGKTFPSFVMYDLHLQGVSKLLNLFFFFFFFFVVVLALRFIIKLRFPNDVAIESADEISFEICFCIESQQRN